MFGFDPLTLGVGTLLWLAFRKQTGTQFGVVTAERQEIFRNAMAHCADPQKLVALSEAFRKEGLKAEAAVLRKRAEWRGRSEEKKKEHAAIFDKALKSENASAILGIAAAFEELTATVKAKQLRDRVQQLNEQALKKQSEVQAKKAEPAPVKETTNGASKTEIIPGNISEKVAEA